MIVPQFWAEARIQNKTRQRQITIRRFGWSDVSQEEAQKHADARAAEAMARAQTDPETVRREPKVPYNGADGVPIREEIVLRHASCLITRNSYGARCLNTPNVLFADIDLTSDPPGWLLLAAAVAFAIGGAAFGWNSMHWAALLGAIVVSTLFGIFLVDYIYRWAMRQGDGLEGRAIERVRKFLRDHRDWQVRIYRTPAGLRVMAIHRTFSPRDPEVSEFFDAIKSDPMYVRMCWNQNCFRARVSAKPWRIGISEKIRPHRGAWPVSPEKMPARTHWIDRYEHAAASYSACHYLESLGSGKVDSEARSVQELHDRLCQADKTLPLA